MASQRKSTTETAKTKEMAIEQGVKKLNLPFEKLDVEVLQEGSKGIVFGIGAKPFIVQLVEKEEVVKTPQKPISKKQTPTIKDKTTNHNRNIQENNASNSKKKHSNNRRELIEYKTYVREADKCDGAEFLLGLLERMNLPATVAYAEEENALYLRISSEFMGIIIGHRGETLDALQYLTSLAINKSSEHYVRVFIDLENYRDKREENLVRLAQRLAKEAYESGDAILLEPMNPYERRIIHACLQNDKRVITYSEGESPERYVVIEAAQVD